MAPVKAARTRRNTTALTAITPVAAANRRSRDVTRGNQGKWFIKTCCQTVRWFDPT